MRPEATSHLPLTLLGLWLVGFAFSSQQIVVGPLLPYLRETFHLSGPLAGLLFSIPILFVACFSLFGGILSDRWGAQRTVVLGLIAAGTGGMARAWATDAGTLFLWTALCGFGVGVLYPSLPKAVATFLPPRLSGFGTSIYATGLSVGPTAALALSVPVLMPVFGGWRWVFLFWGLIAFGVLVFWLVLQPQGRGPLPSRASGGQGFGVLRNRNLQTVAVAFWCQSFLFYNLMGWMPTFFTERGLSATQASLLLTSFAIVAIPVAMTAGWVHRRTGRMLPVIYYAALGALLVLGLVLAIRSPLPLYLLMALLSIFSTSCWVTYLNLPIRYVPPASAGAAAGMALSLGQSGGVVGPIVGGWVRDTTGSFSLVFYVLMGLMALMAFLARFVLSEPTH